ncbi:hypothetical protein RRG08_058980 [Elysia crispata]|uniref:Uncharacterized protein n=1 Tax=Elysia crispata TaxID=231223 RepID=A0AAE1AYP5_9GAST|nr:hypothetical protein RRG08_058980 [Elysia crispata]
MTRGRKEVGGEGRTNNGVKDILYDIVVEGHDKQRSGFPPAEAGQDSLSCDNDLCLRTESRRVKSQHCKIRILDHGG